MPNKTRSHALIKRNAPGSASSRLGARKNEWGTSDLFLTGESAGPGREIVDNGTIVRARSVPRSLGYTTCCAPDDPHSTQQKIASHSRESSYQRATKAIFQYLDPRNRKINTNAVATRGMNWLEGEQEPIIGAYSSCFPLGRVQQVVTTLMLV